MDDDKRAEKDAEHATRDAEHAAAKTAREQEHATAKTAREQEHAQRKAERGHGGGDDEDGEVVVEQPGTAPDETPVDTTAPHAEQR